MGLGSQVKGGSGHRRGRCQVIGQVEMLCEQVYTGLKHSGGSGENRARVNPHQCGYTDVTLQPHLLLGAGGEQVESWGVLGSDTVQLGIKEWRRPRVLGRLQGGNYGERLESWPQPKVNTHLALVAKNQDINKK